MLCVIGRGKVGKGAPDTGCIPSLKGKGRRRGKRKGRGRGAFLCDIPALRSAVLG